MSKDLDNLTINTLRFLAADAVQSANSGHPGLPLGAAPMAYVIWKRHVGHRVGSGNHYQRTILPPASSNGISR